jgi:excisionase family DNA binding protein
MTDSGIETDRLLTVEDIAERLNLSPETIRRWLRTGRLHGIRIGARRAGWRIPERNFDQYLQNQITMTEQSR